MARAMQYRIRTQKTRDSNWTNWSEWRHIRSSDSWTGIDVFSFALEYRSIPFETDKPQFVFDGEPIEL